MSLVKINSWSNPGQMFNQYFQFSLVYGPKGNHVQPKEKTQRKFQPHQCFNLLQNSQSICCKTTNQFVAKIANQFTTFKTKKTLKAEPDKFQMLFSLKKKSCLGINQWINGFILMAKFQSLIQELNYNSLKQNQNVNTKVFKDN